MSKPAESSKSSKKRILIIILVIVIVIILALLIFYLTKCARNNLAGYALEDFQYNTEKLAIKSSDEINADLFGATIKGNDGEKVAVTATLIEGSKIGGGEVSVKLSAIGKDGIEKEKIITGIKVYSEPTLEYHDTIKFIRESDSAYDQVFGIEAIDSFGQSVETTATVIEGEKKEGNTIKIKITVTDPAGNYKEEIFSVDVWGDHYYRVDAKGNYAKDGEYIYFGEYPQTIKAESVEIIGKTPNERGRYLGSDGFYYAKVESAITYSDDKPFCFSDGTTVVTTGETYYFKFEPIKWRIIDADYSLENRTKVFLFCESILDNRLYDLSEPCNNSYEDSEISKWLNDNQTGGFYSTAFSAFEKGHNIQTTIDNSALSTGISPNPNASNNMHQKQMFLLSYKEITNAEYGFKNETAYGKYYQLTADKLRERKVSDYSLANGAFCELDESNSYYRNGIWWTRSPLNDDKKSKSLAVQSDGSTKPFIVNHQAFGVVPAVWIDLNTYTKF